MTEDRPNFFILLGLDPHALWDEMAFRRTIAEKQREWTRKSTGLQTLPATVDAKRYLSLIQTIEGVMRGEDARETERKRALTERTAELKRRRKDLENRLNLMARRGHLLTEEVAELRRSFGDVLAETPALAKRLDKMPVRSQAGPSAPRLDEQTEARLRDHLQNARVRTIYEVLKGVDESVTDQSPLDVLIHAADELYLREHRRKNKSDPAIKARETLSGMAKVLFRTEEERQRHDASMRLTTLRELVDWLLEVLATAKAVTSGQVESFLEEARLRGVEDFDFALVYLRERLAKQGYAVELPASEAEDRLRRLVQCPKCAELNDPGQQVCRTCSFSLTDPCPNCGRVEPRYGGCRCGFPIGQRDVVDDLIVLASEALDDERLAQAENHLDRAERIWRLPPGRDDPISARLRKVRSRWATGTQEIEGARTAIAALMQARQFIAALDALRKAPPGLPGRAAQLERAETMVREARELYEIARRPSTSQERRIALCTEALRLCDDLEVARAELRRIPPETPRDVRAAVSDPDAGVLVSWTGATDPDISYVVVRRTGPDAPESAEDLPGQQRLGETAGSPWRDRSVTDVAGKPLTYAVFAMRSGTYSAPGVAATVVVALDVELRCQAGDGEVVLTWQLPPHAVRIEVSREETGGSDPPVMLPGADASRLVDTGVRNGVRYRYTARVVYPGPGGGLLWSDGRSEQVTPTRRPAPPGPLVLTGSRGQYGLFARSVDIRFPLPERGDMKIVRQPGAGSLREGDQGPQGRLKLDGYVLSDPPPLSDIIFDEAQELFSYVPVLLVDGMAYVGRPRRYAIREEVSDLQGEFAGPELRLGWSWPEGSGQALVGLDAEGEALDATAAERPVTVIRASGEDAGGCVVPIRPEDTEVNVIVALVVQRDGLDFVTGGVRRRLSRPRARVEYQVRRGGRLVLKAADPVELPALVLRARSGRAPHTREDGILVKDIGPLRVTGQWSIGLRRPGDSSLRYRLFTASPADASGVELVPT